MGKKSRSGMNIPGHIFEILEAIFWVILKSTVLQFFDADPGTGIFFTLDSGSGDEKIRIRDVCFQQIHNKAGPKK